MQYTAPSPSIWMHPHMQALVTSSEAGRRSSGALQLQSLLHNFWISPVQVAVLGTTMLQYPETDNENTKQSC